MKPSRPKERAPLTFRKAFENASLYVDQAVGLHLKPKGFVAGTDISVIEMDLTGEDAVEAERLRKLYVTRMVVNSKRNLVPQGDFNRRLFQDAAERASLQDWKKPVVIREMVEFIQQQARGKIKKKEG